MILSEPETIAMAHVPEEPGEVRKIQYI